MKNVFVMPNGTREDVMTGFMDFPELEEKHVFVAFAAAMLNANPELDKSVVADKAKDLAAIWKRTYR